MSNDKDEIPEPAKEELQGGAAPVEKPSDTKPSDTKRNDASPATESESGLDSDSADYITPSTIPDPSTFTSDFPNARVVGTPSGIDEGVDEMLGFRVDVEKFRGPTDLLLYLVKRDEVEVSDIALARVTNQYLEFLEILKEIRIDSVGDFIEVASILVEIKARAVLPRNELEQDEPEADPRVDLVQRLLLYKKFKDAASLLDEHGTQWANRFSRMGDDGPRKKVDMAEQPIHEIELWDLVSAFGRVLRDNRPPPQANIVYDETPIQSYMQRIHKKIVEQGKLAFSELFEPGMHKSAMVGVFLAVLELSRHHNTKTEQANLHGEIWIVPSDGFKENLDVSNVDDYNPHASKFKPGDPAAQVD